MSAKVFARFMLAHNRHGGKCVAPTGGGGRGGEGVFSRRFALKRRREGEKKNNSCRIPFVRLCGSDEETDADLHLDFGMTTPRGNK